MEADNHDRCVGDGSLSGRLGQDRRSGGYNWVRTIQKEVGRAVGLSCKSLDQLSDDHDPLVRYRLVLLPLA